MLFRSGSLVRFVTFFLTVIFAITVVTTDAHAARKRKKKSRRSRTTISATAATGPSIYFSNLIEGQTVVGSLTLNAVATPTSGKKVSKVEFYVTPAGVQPTRANLSRTRSPYTYNWNTGPLTYPDGAYWVQAKVTDSSKATALTTVTAFVDNVDDVPPASLISAPADTATVFGDIMVQASALDDRSGVAKVDFYVDGALLASSSAVSATSGLYEFNWDTATSIEGQHAINLVATDGKGNVAPSNSITVTVDNVPDSNPPTGLKTGEKQVTSCQNYSTNNKTGLQPCAWKYRFDPARCTNAACSKMVVFFSGGQMNCGIAGVAGDYEDILDFYAQHGYVAVCAQTYYNAADSGRYLYSKESVRVNEIMKSIRADATIAGAWNGQDLLFSGGSHGATSPVLSMARSDYDSTSTWKGSRKTAACYFDGVYDQNAQLQFTIDNNCHGTVANMVPLSFERQVDRYCGVGYAENAEAVGAVNPVCPTYATASADDTVVGVDPSAFSVTKWKLISCGSNPNNVQGWPACNWDVVANEPVQALCNKLNGPSTVAGTPAHSCSYKALTLPQYNHYNCAQQGIEECRTWFEQLPSQ